MTIGKPKALQRVTAATSFKVDMLRWLIVVFLALLLISWVRPWLEKMGLGKLPGDFHFKLFGREWFIPFTSTLLLSFALSLLTKLL
jgi:hypothetical protein